MADSIVEYLPTNNLELVGKVAAAIAQGFYFN